MLTYPADFTRENGGFVVTVPDIPGAITEGDSEQEAYDRAVEAITLALDGLVADRQPVPAPSVPRVDQRLITLPSIVGIKLDLYREMREQGVSKAELARRLNSRQAAADRLLDLFHNSRLDAFDRAFEALGARIDISLRRIA